MRTWRRWLLADDAMLAEMHFAGIPKQEIADRLDRTFNAVVFRLGYRGLGKRAVPHFDWTEEHKDRLRSMHADRIPVAKIASALGVKETAVHMMKNRLGLVRSRPTPEMIDRIAEMIEEGKRHRQIVKATGATEDHVKYYVRKSGAVNRRSYCRGDNQPYDQALFDLEAEGLSYAEIARRLELTVSIVRGRLITLSRREQVIELNGPSAIRTMERRAA